MSDKLSVNNSISNVALFCNYIASFTNRHGLDSFAGLLLLILRENPETAEFYFKYKTEPVNQLLEKQLITETENGYSFTSKGAIFAKSISDSKIKFEKTYKF